MAAADVAQAFRLDEDALEEWHERLWAPIDVPDDEDAEDEEDADDDGGLISIDLPRRKPGTN